MGIADRLVVTSVPDLYLASTSPRRKALLAAACITFALCEPGPEYLPGSGDEHTSVLGDPVALAAERARRKGLGAEPPDPGRPVLAVDTVVDLDGVEFGKPSDRVHAERMLRQLAGRMHRVHTAHCLSLPSRGLYVEEVSHATVRCGPVVEASLQHYLDSGQWRGKAGSYGMQDDAQDFFALVDGAFDTVVGLHVPAVHRLLAALRSRS
jgi:septum formation protein